MTRTERFSLVLRVALVLGVTFAPPGLDAQARDGGVQASAPGLASTVRWGVQSPDLVRYNRIEGFSVGVRAQVRPRSPWGFMTVAAEGRIGSVDREPNVRVGVSTENLARRLTVRAYRELAPVEEGRGHLRLGNSLTGLLIGRDDGEYYRRTGGSVEVRSPGTRSPAFRVTAFAEHHDPVEPAADFHVWGLVDDASSFRENLIAREGAEFGAAVRLDPWWGTDPRDLRGGLTAGVRAAAGDWEYVRAHFGGEVIAPLLADLSVSVEAEAGTSWGDLPPQRRWLIGGAGSLAGYAPRSLEGTSRFRGRAEVAWRTAFGSVSGFTAVGWAGEREAFDLEDALPSVGVGLSLADGLIRVDVGKGLRGPREIRLDAYLDAPL